MVGVSAGVDPRAVVAGIGLGMLLHILAATFGGRG